MSTTTEQTGRAEGTDHPSLIKYNVLCKSFLSLLTSGAGDWAPFILCQDFGFCCSWFPSYAWGVGRKQSTEPEQWVQRALGHMTTPTSSPTLPCLSFPPLLSKCQKLITPTSRETICYSKYGEVWLVISMTIHAVLWREMRHNGCVLPHQDW